MYKLINSSTLLVTVLLIGTGVIFIACDDNGTNSGDVNNIVQTAQSSSDFDILVQALQDAGLVTTLSGNGPFTVFAPTDDAFGDLPAGTLENLTNDQLVSILTYHVLNGNILAGDLIARQNPESLEGGALFIEADNGVVVNDNANVIQADIGANNGVIHAIDRVLFPDAFLDVVGVISKRFNLQTLEDAVIAADLVSTLQQESQDGFTVFAPLNSAFDDITVPSDQQQLQDILSYHVIPTKVLSGDLQPSQTVTTVNGSDVTIEVNNGTVTINGSAVVTTADLEGSNGVVHIIDEVLIPPSN